MIAQSNENEKAAAYDGAYRAAAKEASSMDYGEIMDACFKATDHASDCVWGTPSETEIEPAMRITITGRRSVFDLFAEGYSWEEAESMASIEVSRTIELPECPAAEFPEGDHLDLQRCRARADVYNVALDAWNRGIDADLDDEKIQNNLRALSPEGLPSMMTHAIPDFPEHTGDPGPIPRHLLDVPGLVGEVAQFTTSTAKRRQPWLALAGAVALQAALIGRKVRDAYGTRPNLQIIVVADTGKGKDRPRAVNAEILERVEPKLLAPEEMASEAGLYSLLANHETRLWQCDEFGRFLRTTGSAKNSPHLFAIPSALMRLYTSAGKLFLPKAYGESKRNIEIDQPCLILFATSAPDQFYGALSADTVADGLLGRCLIIEGMDHPPRNMVREPPVPDSIMDTVTYWTQYQPGGGNLADKHPTPTEIETTLEAQLTLSALANAAESRQYPKHRGSALWARCEEKANQLSLVYACSANPQNPVVDGAAANWAAELSYHICARMAYLASIWVSSNEQESRQQRVLRIIQGVGGTIGRRELTRATQWLKVRERDEILNGMEQAGLIARATDGKKEYFTTA